MSETKTPKEFRKATIGIFLTAAELLGKTHSELSECLGYNGNPWRKWIADGEMPYVASIACEHLLARKEARPCILMVSAPPDKRTALESVMRAMGIEFTQIVL